MPLGSGPSWLGTVVRYLGESHRANVVGLDLGRVESTLVVWHEGRLTVVTRDGPTASAEGRARNRALIADLWRQCDVGSEDAAHHQSPRLDVIVVRGPAVAQGVAPLELARLLVDTLQPVGACTLLWDRDGLAVPLAALAVNEPALAAHLLDTDAFIRLGTVIAPCGHSPSGGTAIRFTLAEPQAHTQQGSVAAGHLHQVSLPPGHSARLTLHLATGLDLGMAGLDHGAQAEVPGGLVGLLLDGRGRPLPS